MRKYLKYNVAFPEFRLVDKTPLNMANKSDHRRVYKVCRT